MKIAETGEPGKGARFEITVPERGIAKVRIRNFRGILFSKKNYADSTSFPCPFSPVVSRGKDVIHLLDIYCVCE